MFDLDRNGAGAIVTPLPRHVKLTTRASPAHLLLAGLLLFGPSTVAAQVVQLDDIPNPRPASWTVDLTGQVDAWARDSIDRLADDADRQLDGQIAVVVVDRIASTDPRAFATDLFNLWGIGSASRNDGVLILVALGDRAAELVLGDGVDDAAQISMADQIMQQLMVPRLRDGDVTNAVLLGAQAAVMRILRSSASSEVAIEPIGNVPLEAGGEPLPVVDPQAPAVTVPEADNGGGGWGALPIVGGLAGLAGLFGLGRRRIFRYRSRNCMNCGDVCVRLSEARDDDYLDAGERVEEAVGSVDYDVWACSSCGEAEKLRYGAFFTRYSKCPRCHAKTKNKTTNTLRAATYSHGGLVEIEERCANCAYQHRYRRSTPQLTRSTSSGSSSGSSSSFGGGSSSGSGASGRW